MARSRGLGDVYKRQVKISDCNRAVSLSFDYSNQKEKMNSEYKLDKLISELTLLREKVKQNV
jgi:hypothetical protein